MKTQELKQKTTLELQKTLKELREKMFEFKILKVQNQFKKPHLLKQIRKDIAKVLTVINDKK